MLMHSDFYKTKIFTSVLNLISIIKFNFNRSFLTLVRICIRTERNKLLRTQMNVWNIHS